MLSYRYERLERFRDIRLLELNPSEDPGAPPVCCLVHVNLSKVPAYEALSYVWGKRKTKSSIVLNSQTFTVTSNLAAILRRLRRKNISRRLWVDAICIDQGDIDERNQQVSLMRYVYNQAEQVVVWLGEAADESHLVFQHIKEWQASQEQPARRTSRLRPLAMPPHMPWFEGATLEAYEKLCQRPWFTRLWVVQEIVLSRRAIVLCGQDEELFNRLIPGFSKYNDFHHPLNRISGTDRLKRLDEMRLLGGSEGLACTSDFGSLLGYTRLCEATDPKDKVYGVLGLFNQQLMPIDYNFSVAEVYRDVTRAIFDTTGSLQILHLVGTARCVPELPSWAFDFSITNPAGILPRRENTFRSDFPKQAILGKGTNKSDLPLCGKRITRVFQVGEELVADHLFRPHSEKFLAVLHQWEAMASDIKFKPFDQRLIDAFQSTLTGNNPTSISCISLPGPHDFLLWYDRHGSGAFTEADVEAFRKEVLAPKHYFKEKEEEMVNRYAQELGLACYGRRFFVSDDGSMGLAPPGVRAGDTVVFFPGGLFPFVVSDREDGIWCLVGDCFLYNLDVYTLMADESKKMKKFTLQ